MTQARLRWLVHSVGGVSALLVQALLWASYYGFANKQLVGDEVRYLHTAMTIWQGQAPLPDFIWPPLQPWFLAPLVGPLAGSLWLAQLLQMLLLVASALLLRQIWLRIDPRPLAADMAAWRLLSSPAVMAFGLYLWPEPLHMFMLMAALWLLVCHVRSWPAAGLAGIAIGLALLSKSLLSGFWPLLLLLCLRHPWRTSHWASGAAFVLATLMVTGPSLLHGWQATGKPLIADSASYNLYVGLNDQWRSDYIADRGGDYMRQYLQSGSSPRERSRSFDALIDVEVRDKGLTKVVAERVQVQYFRLFSAKRTLLSQLPGPACAGYLGAYTLPRHWVTAVRVLAQAHYVLLLLSAAFAVASWQRRSMLLLVLALFFAYQMALFLALHVQARFLLPMLPFMAGFAASGISQLLPDHKGQAVSPLSVTGGRMVLAVLLGALLLLLAFGGPWLDQSCAGGL